MLSLLRFIGLAPANVGLALLGLVGMAVAAPVLLLLP